MNGYIQHIRKAADKKKFEQIVDETYRLVHSAENISDVNAAIQAMTQLVDEARGHLMTSVGILASETLSEENA